MKKSSFERLIDDSICKNKCYPILRRKIDTQNRKKKNLNNRTTEYILVNDNELNIHFKDIKVYRSQRNQKRNEYIKSMCKMTNSKTDTHLPNQHVTPVHPPKDPLPPSFYTPLSMHSIISLPNPLPIPFVPTEPIPFLSFAHTDAPYQLPFAAPYQSPTAAPSSCQQKDQSKSHYLRHNKHQIIYQYHHLLQQNHFHFILKMPKRQSKSGRKRKNSQV